MEKKFNSESREFEKLKDLGFEFGKPQDEFSYQPDSGSGDDGSIGRDEFGVDVDSDAEGREAEAEREKEMKGAEDPSLPIPGESEWSQDNRMPNEDLPTWRIRLKDEDLFALVTDRLQHHPQFSDAKIVVTVEASVVSLKGEVSSAAAKLLGSEIVSALPGVSEIKNDLQVIRPEA